MSRLRSKRKKLILELKTIARVIMWPLAFAGKRRGVLLVLWLVTFPFFLFVIVFIIVAGPPSLPQDPFDILFLFRRNPGYVLALVYILVAIAAIPSAWSIYKEESRRLKEPTYRV